jgi:uncharacterized protein YdcH (DUF465 family)
MMAKRAILSGGVEPQRLMEEHARLDRRVRELDRRVGLSPDEQFELTSLKKQKLALKYLIRDSVPPGPPN